MDRLSNNRLGYHRQGTTVAGDASSGEKSPIRFGSSSCSEAIAGSETDESAAGDSITIGCVLENSCNAASINSCSDSVAPASIRRFEFPVLLAQETRLPAAGRARVRLPAARLLAAQPVLQFRAHSSASTSSSGGNSTAAAVFGALRKLLLGRCFSRSPVDLLQRFEQQAHGRDQGDQESGVKQKRRLLAAQLGK